MEFVILAKVGMVVNWIANGGYVLAGGIFLKTIVKYTKDYKESVANEKDGI